MRVAPLLALAACVGGAAAAGCADDSDTFVDCSARLTWRGGEYIGDGGARDGLPPAAAPATPKGKTYFCDDPHPTTVYRIAGVDPRLALRTSTAPGSSEVWRAAGFFPQLPSHPLHRAFYGSDARPYRAGDHRRCAFRGRVTDARRDLAVAGDTAQARVIIDARTRIAGAPTVAGQPLLREGATVTIRARRCADATDPADPRSPRRQMTAVRITVA